MKKRLVRLLSCLSIGLIMGCGGPPPAEEQARVIVDNPDVVTLVENNVEFSVELYKKLAVLDDQNLFLSPYSIQSAFGMTYAGARGETAREMKDVLRFNLPDASIHGALSDMTTQLMSSAGAGYELSIVNRLWLHQRLELDKEFQALNRKYYNAEVDKLDFADSDRSRKKINQWVESETKNIIKDLIPAGGVNPDTRLVLTNAIYFKGQWSEAFDPDDTKSMTFLKSPEMIFEAPLMHQISDFEYAEVDGVRLLAMPYVGGRIELIAVLPVALDGLAEVEAALTGEALQSWLEGMETQEVSVWFPRFKLERAASLKKALVAMGMISAFGQSADFSGVTADDDLYIEDAFHKASVELNEEGTEAAAATAVVMATKSVKLPPKKFRADHPFLFVIRDKKTGAILFIGRVTDPR